MQVGAQAAARGYRIERFDRLGSTNDVAMTRARAAEKDRLWIVADEQTGGRGRLGRRWWSPRGNLYASLLLIDPAPMDRAPELGFVTGVALARALESLTKGSARVALKWPNDALLDDAKVSGVLLEATTTPSGRFACVVGIGVNCISHPIGLPYRSTDLRAQGFAVERDDLFEALSDAMALAIDDWAAGAAFASVRQAWLDRAAGLNAPIEVAVGDALYAGVFRAIDAHGRLVLADASGERVIDAGDVLFPLAAAPRAGERSGVE